MRRRWVLFLFQLSTALSSGVLLGEGCIGPGDLREGFVASFNDMVYRGIELFLANVFNVPLATA